MSCPDGYALYDSGMIQKYKGISDGEIDRNTTLVCEKHDNTKYWRTAQGGKLFYPNCMPVPGCNCSKGEM